MPKYGSRNITPAPPLPMTREEMSTRGWNELDVLLISGDAYVDHPAFGIAVLARLLEHHGYRVGVVAQPRWDSTENISRLGAPRLFVGISAGSTDSMLALRTSHRKNRKFDRCSEGGQPGKRPPRAGIVYSHLAREAFGDVPIILGGVEASCRRFTYYDFWQDRLRKPYLIDAKADLLVWGMGEQASLEIARRLEKGQRDLSSIPSTCRICREPQEYETISSQNLMKLPSFEKIMEDPYHLITSGKILESASRKRPVPRIFQGFQNRGILAEPPPPVETGRSLDKYFELPYTRAAHPIYKKPIPALDTVKWSITSHRGCFGGCSFCSVSIHSGHKIGNRTTASLVREAAGLTRMKGFHGTITDVGGPTANMYKMGCRTGAKGGSCRRVSCLYPSICSDLNTSHDSWLDMLEKIRGVPGVSSVRVASGIRHDLILENREALWPLLLHYTGGRMRVAPEHVAGKVLRLMRKRDSACFNEFMNLFNKTKKKCPKKVEAAAYFMTSFPGSGPWETDLLARALQSWGINNYEVQCFTPTPATMATAMFFAQKDEKGKPLDVQKDDRSRKESTTLLEENDKKRQKQDRPERTQPKGAEPRSQKPKNKTSSFEKPKSKKQRDKKQSCKKQSGKKRETKKQKNRKRNRWREKKT